MPHTEKNVTDSWKAYEDCLGAIQLFLTEIRIQDGEAWVGEVCFGSPDQPLVRAPLRRDSADLVRDSVRVVTNVIESIHKAVETSRRILEKLKAEGEVETIDVKRVLGRIESLEQLLTELTSGGRGATPARSHSQRTAAPVAGPQTERCFDFIRQP